MYSGWSLNRSSPVIVIQCTYDGPIVRTLEASYYGSILCMGPSYVWWVESGDFPLIIQNDCI